MTTAPKRAPGNQGALKNNQTSARGGRRANAGRKAGTPNRATQERQKKVAETGVTPLQVMLDNMRWAHKGATVMLKRLSGLKKVDGDTIVLIRELEKLRGIAQDCAKDAAPYVHPKLQSVLHGQDPDREAVHVVHEISQGTIDRLRKAFVGEPT